MAATSSPTSPMYYIREVGEDSCSINILGFDDHMWFLTKCETKSSKEARKITMSKRHLQVAYQVVSYVVYSK